MNFPSIFRKVTSLVKLYKIDSQIAQLVWQIKKSNKTFLSYPKLLSLVESFHLVHNSTKASIQIAEFGVGRGGSAMVLAFLVEKYRGHLTLYDLFERIPRPTASNGLEAHQRYQQILQAEDQDNYYGNIPDLLSVVKHDLSKIVDMEKVDFIVGKYEETLPTLNDDRRYHLVHVDCDWYESTYAVLKYLKNRLHQTAIVQFDDYEYWSGTKKAVDDTAWLHDFPRLAIDEALVIHLFRT